MLFEVVCSTAVYVFAVVAYVGFFGFRSVLLRKPYVIGNIITTLPWLPFPTPSPLPTPIAGCRCGFIFVMKTSIDKASFEVMPQASAFAVVCSTGIYVFLRLLAT